MKKKTFLKIVISLPPESKPERINWLIGGHTCYLSCPQIP